MVQTIVTRSVNPYEKALITIGKIRGGESRNVLPERVKMQATVRTFKDYVYTGIKERILDILEGLETATGVKTKFEEVMRYPVLNNPLDLNEELVAHLEYEDIIFLDEMMAAEDFSFYQQEIPALFFFLGVGAENSLHSNLFDFDERALLGGLEIYRRILFG
jgi:metal-dependent amidase/aminoacylase/carboxypeptidase family protein